MGSGMSGSLCSIGMKTYNQQPAILTQSVEWRGNGDKKRRATIPLHSIQN